MQPTGLLYDLAASAGVIVRWWHFAPPIIGIYLRDERTHPAIGLDYRLKKNPPLMRCVLAEELGHHFATTGERVMRPFCREPRFPSREEQEALAWAARVLIPPEDLGMFIRESKPLEMLAAMYGVTPGFVDAALRVLPLSTVYGGESA